MAEQLLDQEQTQPTLETSRNLGMVIQVAVAATRKIGASLMKITRDIAGMIFK